MIITILSTTQDIGIQLSTQYAAQKKKNTQALFQSSIRVLCPTRWTVKANALASIMSNFETLKLTWEKDVSVVQDTEAKARIHEVSIMMSNFNYLFGKILGEMLLKHADNLSSTLQHKTFSAGEVRQL